MYLTYFITLVRSDLLSLSTVRLLILRTIRSKVFILGAAEFSLGGCISLSWLRLLSKLISWGFSRFRGAKWKTALFFGWSSCLLKWNRLYPELKLDLLLCIESFKESAESFLRWISFQCLVACGFSITKIYKISIQRNCLSILCGILVWDVSFRAIIRVQCSRGRWEVSFTDSLGCFEWYRSILS